MDNINKLVLEGFASGFTGGMTIWFFTYCIAKLVKFFNTITQ